LKILQINSVCGYGSTGRIATDLYKLLEKQGHDCVIAYGRGSAPKGIRTIKIGSKFDNYTHVAQTRLFDTHGFGSIKATKEFIKKAKEYDPDVIHLHNIHGYYINIKLLFNYLKEIQKPVVWTLHDCWSFTGHCSHFDYIGCDKWKEGCFKCPQKRSYPKSFFLDNSKNNYRRKNELFNELKNMTLVTPSKWLANLVKESFLGDYNIKVINNGINLEKFKPLLSNFRRKNNLDDKFIILGVASVWDTRKGFDSFLELSKCIEKNDQIVLVGLNDKQLKDLPKNITGIKRTNNIEELAEIYSTADGFVNPTLQDNFPTTNLESLACGTPVITFNTGGSVESIDQSCGLIVEKESIKGLVEAISRIKIKSFSKSNCLKMASQFDMNDRFNEYIKLYKKVMK